MSRIQSSVGLITGVPITDTVDQLIAISARPRDMLTERTKLLQAQQAAVTEITALVVSTELAVQRLGDTTLFHRKQAASSLDDVLTATITGTPAAGSYRFTTARMAQAHQVLSDGFAQRDAALGAGQISIRFGGFVDRGVMLDELNGGNGVERGKIRITDRSGSSAVIDLRAALTIDDVVNAINAADTISVTASAAGDRLQLVDDTGQVVSNLKVQEVGLGRTAADLGLAGVNVAAEPGLRERCPATACGDQPAASERRQRRESSQRRPGSGSHFPRRQRPAADRVRCADQGRHRGHGRYHRGQRRSTHRSSSRRLARVRTTTATASNSWTMQQILAGSETVEVNSTSKQLTIHIDAGNTRAYQVIEAINNDNTAKQFFSAAAAAGGNASGIVTTNDTGTTSGGAAAYNDEKTVGDLLATLNAADPTRLQARLSASGDRIELVDLTVDTGGTFQVTSLFGGTVAEDLGLTVSASGGVISGRRRLAGLDSVLLDSLAGGRGIGSLGQLDLQDRAGSSATIDLSQAETLDDVLDAINQSGVAITATINAARNGLLLTDTSGGTGQMVVDDGDGTATATKLGIKISAAADSIDSGSLDLQTYHQSLELAVPQQRQRRPERLLSDHRFER